MSLGRSNSNLSANQMEHFLFSQRRTTSKFLVGLSIVLINDFFPENTVWSLVEIFGVLCWLVFLFLHN